MATNPGIRVLLADGYFNAAEDNTGAASRLLIVARASRSSSAGWRASANGQALYNPVLYKTEAEVVADWGSGSDAHIAFVQAVTAGPINVYISATDPDPTKTTDSGYTADEYEVVRALAYAESVRPDYIAVFGYEANDFIDATEYTNGGATANRCARYAETLATICHDLTELVHPCFGFISPMPLADHLRRDASYTGTVVEDNITAAQVSTYVGFLHAAAHATFDYTDFDPLPLAEVAAQVQSASVDEDYTKYIAVPVGEVQVLNQPKSEMDYATELKLSTISLSTNHILVSTATTHGLATGDYVVIKGVKSDGDVCYNGIWEVHEDSGDQTFTIAVTATNDAALDVSNAYVGKVTGGSAVVRYKSAPVVVAVQAAKYGTASAITLKQLANVTALNFDVSRSLRIDLMDSKALPIGIDTRNGIVTVDGISFAQPDSNGEDSVFTRLFTCTTVNEVLAGTRDVIEPYIGTPAGVARLNALETQLRSYYLDLKQNERVREVRFTFSYSPAASKVNVNIVILPVGELREVEVNVSVEI
jgi:hypothetical protein